MAGQHWLKDLTGQRFGRLTVTERAGSSFHKTTGRILGAKWKTVCDCGETRVNDSNGLLRGTSKSCGCLARELRSAKLRMPDGVAARNHIFNEYKNAAAKRGYEWSISDATFDNLIKQNCTYCGSEPIGVARIEQRSSVHKRELKQLLYNGIDRVDNSRGYTEDNVVPCCKVCNRCKHVLSGDDFVKLAHKIVSRHPAYFLGAIHETGQTAEPVQRQPYESYVSVS